MARFPHLVTATALLLSLAAVSPALARNAKPGRPAVAAQTPAAPAAPAALVAPPPVLLPAALPSLSSAEEYAISRSEDGLVPMFLAGGTVGLNLQGRFQDFATVTVGPGGKLTFRCVNDAMALRRILATPALPEPATLEDR